MPDPDVSFAARLIRWQRQRGRHDLPWQNTRDAYRIWLSEIMLQQTQVATVIPYYQRFLERFPDVQTLAAAPVDAVLEHWAGLGYYARARNLHRCAQAVVEEHGGVFPQDPQQLASLPGIGRSTAAAIAAFAFGARAAILDGNVKRVLARCFGIEGFPGSAAVEKEMWRLAESLLPAAQIEAQIGAYTQGIMDLGATLCGRANPACGDCPMAGICVARRDGRQAELPVAKPGKPLPRREVSMLVLTDGCHVLLERRPPAGIWGGLLALPEGSEKSAGSEKGADSFAARHGCRLVEARELPAVQHGFSHFHLTIRPLFCRVEPDGCRAEEPGWEWLAVGNIASAALPAPLKRLLLGAFRS